MNISIIIIIMIIDNNSIIIINSKGSLWKREPEYRILLNPVIQEYLWKRGFSAGYTRSPLEDSRLFGPSPWKVLRHYL